jgi:hypothetical protein
MFTSGDASVMVVIAVTVDYTDNPLQQQYGIMEKKPLHSECAMVLKAANAGDERFLAWLRRVERHGVTHGLAEDINKKLLGFQMPACFVFNTETGKLEPGFFPFDLPKNDEVMIAFSVAVALADGALDTLKRCALKECSKYFVGDPRAKWCSETCGSKYRVRNKRKKDKQRQML